MLKLLLDENFDNDILRGVLRSNPGLDYLRVQDVPEIYTADDRLVLAWAAQADRVVVTHDVQTLIGFAYERIAAAEPMPGVIEILRDEPIRLVIEDLLILLECTTADEIRDQVRYVPFK